MMLRNGSPGAGLRTGSLFGLLREGAGRVTPAPSPQLFEMDESVQGAGVSKAGMRENPAFR